VSEAMEPGGGGVVSGSQADPEQTAGPAGAEEGGGRRLARRPRVGWACGALALAALGAAWWATGTSGTPAAAAAFATPGEPASAGDVRRLEARLGALRPRGVYIVVDSVANRLYLRRGDETVREAVCSTGTGVLLEDPAGGRQWVFDTPRGAHRVLEKRRRPVWTKPDWAFIEEGKPVPASFRERLDPTALGAYGLYFGDGYIIHGTLYKRLLGRSVTHGCVRLGDEDLEAVYRAAPVGTPVYVF